MLAIFSCYLELVCIFLATRQCVCDGWYLDWPKHAWLFRGNSPLHGYREKQPKPANSSLKLWAIHRVTHWRKNQWEIWGDMWQLQYKTQIRLHYLWQCVKYEESLHCLFPSAIFESEDGEDDLENSNLWEDISENFQDDVESIQSSCHQQRLQCFAHSLQLVVRDGLKETKTLNSALAKVTKFGSLLHSTWGLKEAFEGQNGANRSITSAVSTRWNLTLRLVEAITDLDPQSLNALQEAQGHKGLCLSAREWSQLKELVEILAPFLQATDLTQGEKVVTLSEALPCVLSLKGHLNSMLSTTRHLAGFAKALQKSLQCRFRGIFANVRMDDSAQPTGDLPFADMVYMMSALLDLILLLLAWARCPCTRWSQEWVEGDDNR